MYQDPEVVRGALNNEFLVPPTRPESLGRGSTAELRDAMARFSFGDTHGDRRALVAGAIEQIDAKPIEEIAAVCAGRRLVDDEVEAVSALGHVVPTETICVALGLEAEIFEQTVADVALMVEAIGRGVTATSAHDAAVDRMRSRIADREEDTVALLSVFYQNFDATIALFASTLMAHSSGVERRSALARTVREAVADTSVGQAKVQAGDTFALGLDSLELEFGAGAHKCPGERLVKRIVNSMIEAIDDAGFKLAIDQVETNADGRPVTLPLRRLT